MFEKVLKKQKKPYVVTHLHARLKKSDFQFFGTLNFQYGSIYNICLNYLGKYYILILYTFRL
jgi:hypothetical protein